MIALLVKFGLWFVKARAAAARGFAWLVGHPKVLLALIIAAILAIGWFKANSFVNNLKEQIETLQGEKAQLTEKNEWFSKRVEQLEKDILEAKQINEENERIIAKLEKIRSDLLVLISDLRKQGKQAEGELDNLKKKLVSMSEADNGPISVILKEAILEIEKNRSSR